MTTRDHTETFYNLTPDRVFDAVEVGGRRCTGRFLVLNSYENRVYQLELDDGTFVVGKFYRPGRWSLDAIYDEHDFLDELAEVEVPVAAPLDLRDDDTVGSVEGIWYSVFPRIGGRAPEEMDDAELREVGRLIARIHSVGRAGEAPHRRELTPHTYGVEPMRALLEADSLPREFRGPFERTAEAFVRAIEPLFAGRARQRIHGDCHIGNLLRSPAGLVILDFDDLVIGPPVQDLWMLWGGRDAWGLRRRDVLLEGYESMASFDRGSLALVEALRGLRYLHYAAWLARRWEDPAFPPAFPDFGTEGWWARRIADLREQLDLVREQTAGMVFL